MDVWAVVKNDDPQHIEELYQDFRSRHFTCDRLFLFNYTRGVSADAVDAAYDHGQGVATAKDVEIAYRQPFEKWFTTEELDGKLARQQLKTTKEGSMKIYVQSQNKGEAGAVVVATALRELGHEVTEVIRQEGTPDWEMYNPELYDEEEPPPQPPEPPVIDVLITAMVHDEFGWSECWCVPKRRMDLRQLLLRIVETVNKDTLAEYLLPK